MALDRTIFRAYDIRGKADSQITEEACELIGKGFGSILRERTKKDHPILAVGRDARTHSPKFEKTLVKGLMSTGCHILLIGETPSPVNYFTLCHEKLDGSVQVTASHNPSSDNGLKLQCANAEAFSGDELQMLYEKIVRGDFVQGEGQDEKYDALTPYKKKLTALFQGVGTGMSIVLDGGNGIAGPTNSDILKAIGARVIGLYLEPDGTFPNHPADPSKHATLAELQALVKKEKADVGFAFDGDGDRMGLVDEQGKIVTADETLLLLSEDHLSRHHGNPIVFTVSNSSLLETEVKRWGGKPVICKVGHSFVEHAMRDHGALLGGEQSGHFFCGENYYSFDDALVATLCILKILQRREKTLSTIVDAYPKVFQAHERRPHCPDDKKATVVQSIIDHFAKTHPVNTLDGARIDFGDGAWAGIRQSNTSPCLSICIEARSQQKLQAVEREVLEHLGTYKDVDLA
jgi:phosphomannomutase